MTFTTVICDPGYPDHEGSPFFSVGDVDLPDGRTLYNIYGGVRQQLWITEHKVGTLEKIFDQLVPNGSWGIANAEKLPPVHLYGDKYFLPLLLANDTYESGASYHQRAPQNDGIPPPNPSEVINSLVPGQEEAEIWL